MRAIAYFLTTGFPAGSLDYSCGHSSKDVSSMPHMQCMDQGKAVLMKSLSSVMFQAAIVHRSGASKLQKTGETGIGQDYVS